jgi:antitoxin (DNA-binding transcriptional repressor) of toxin-antitoxin stability system
MKFMSIRDFRSRPIRKDLVSEGEIVLTANGQPIAIVSPVHADTLEDELLAWRRARARIALERIRARARTKGLDELTMDEIDAEIVAARRERRTVR